MGFKNKDGEDLLPFKTQEEAFNHWARSTKGRPCDYTGMSYAKLTGGSGIQWPCNEEYPDGRPRLVSQPRGTTGQEKLIQSYNSTMTVNSSPSPKKQKASATIWSWVCNELLLAKLNLTILRRYTHQPG
jgi:ferredoxin-nitrate reductase